jgi:hypothetical protein
MPEATLPVAPSFFVTRAAKHRESPAALSHKWQKKVRFKARALTHSLLVAHDHSRQPATTNDNAHRNPGSGLSGPYEDNELTEEQ